MAPCPAGTAILHGRAARLHGAHRIGKGERSRNHVRRPLAQRVPGGQRRLHAVLGQHARRRHAYGHDGRLRVLGQPQILFRPLETEPRKREAERRVGLGEGLCRDRKTLGKIAAHANGLRTLPRKEKSDLGSHFREDCSGYGWSGAGVHTRRTAGLGPAPLLISPHARVPSIPAARSPLPGSLVPSFPAFFSSTASCRRGLRRSGGPGRRIGRCGPGGACRPRICGRRGGASSGNSGCAGRTSSR